MEIKNDKAIVYSERKECIKNIAQFLTDLKLDNIHEEFYVFCYMLWKGYFSFSNKFVYSRENMTRNSVDYSVFLGKGTSTHVSNLLTSVFDKQGLLASTIGVSIKKIDLDDVISVKRNFESEIKNFSECKKYINQRVTFVGNVDNEKRSFIFDPILLSESEVLSNYRLKCVNNKYMVNRKRLKYVLTRYCFNDYGLAKISNVREGKILDSYKRMNEFCLDNEEIFDNFYKENKSHYEKIKTLL